MSANPEQPRSDLVTIEIDGREFRVPKGSMIIKAADEAGINIPRFCYHNKLSIAANCRMCLVEVEKAPKPLPACATPVADGMKVHTKSDYAKRAQQAVMEFLLINHPLDCPICDQGGECELQDLALGYGRSVSRFAEKKRIVKDKNIGPLISTDMTRCIHCTRCIRFLDEIAGERELGATERGEHMKIGTYVEQSLTSELSGNVIDVCPVGALTSKPFRFRARAWEMHQHPWVAPHDSTGANLWLHVLRGEVMRVVPRENEAVNEVWISDRDRYSYLGLTGPDRLRRPEVKVDGEWKAVEWPEALSFTAKGLQHVVEEHGADQLGMLVSPTATTEEMYLIRRLADGLGCTNLDHRIRQGDFANHEHAPPYPWLGQTIQDLQEIDAALIVGSNIRKEHPLLATRLRKAVGRGARVVVLNPLDWALNFPVARKMIVAPRAMVTELAGIAAAMFEALGQTIPQDVAQFLDDGAPGTGHRETASMLLSADAGTVLLGNLAVSHEAFSVLRSLAEVIAGHTGARLGFLPEHCNTVGAWLSGMVPHRGVGGGNQATPGLNAREMIERSLRGYVLFNVEPHYECWNPGAAGAAISGAEFTVSIAPFADERMRASADVLLPIGSLGETPGTFYNLEGRLQSFAAAVPPPGEARPGWKVLRVLGNELGLPGFEYQTDRQILQEFTELIRDVRPANIGAGQPLRMPAPTTGLERIGDMPIYRGDSLVRHSGPLQASPDGGRAAAWINAGQARDLGLEGVSRVRVRQDDCETILELFIDDRVPTGCVRIPTGYEATADLGPVSGPVELAAME